MTRPIMHRMDESLRVLQGIISKVNKQCTSKHDIVVTFLYADEVEVIYECMVEFGYRDTDAQLAALRKMQCLVDYLMKNSDTTGFYWHKGRRTVYSGNPSKVISDDLITDLTLSRTGEGGGFVFSIPKLGINYAQAVKSRIGIMTGCRHQLKGD